MSTLQFTGFTPATIQFFKDLKSNNNKPWFDAHKPVYVSEILNRMKTLIVALTPAMQSIDPKFDFNPNKILSRIYRDIRFSPDKTPYKTHLWMTFQRFIPDGQWESFPAFFMEISEEGYDYGMGLYGSKKKIIDNLRERIIDEPDHFREITEPVLKRGFNPEGETYKKPVKNDLPEYFQPWFNYKYAYVIKTCPVGKEMFSEKFAEILADDFLTMKPFYEFLVDACDI
ncbi:MAG: DUF2461 domain-containing protein [Candidatus Azobacteroides sp.]|nr:DUF2461 domain-containing protein [Candidatus Azobacteroides sp.]